MKVAQRFMAGISRFEPTDGDDLAEFHGKFFGYGGRPRGRWT